MSNVSGTKRKRSDSTTKSTQKKAKSSKSLVQTIKKIVRNQQELKQFDVWLTSHVPLTNAGQIWGLTNVNQGTTDNQRVGDHLTPKSLRFRAHFQAVAGQVQMAVRVILFRWDRNTTDVTGASTPPVPQDLIQVLNNVVTPVYPTSWDLKDNFTIIRDHQFWVQDQANTEMIEWYIDCTKGRAKTDSIDYVGGSTDGIHKFYVAMYTETSSNGPSVVFSNRFSFFDA